MEYAYVLDVVFHTGCSEMNVTARFTALLSDCGRYVTSIGQLEQSYAMLLHIVSIPEHLCLRSHVASRFSLCRDIHHSNRLVL